MTKIFFFLLLFSTTTLAEGPPWKRITHFNIVDGKVGLTLTEGNFSQDMKGPFFYVLNPTNWAVEPIEEGNYKSRFGSEPSEVAGAKWGNLPQVINTSVGDVLKLENTECEAQEEGGPLCKVHFLTYNNKRIKLASSERASVLFAERWDNPLWLGLGVLGELELYGDGVEVYDLKSGHRIFSYKESTMGGLLPSAIKRDRKTGDTWIATNLGFRIVDAHLKTTKKYFMHEEFNAATGNPQIAFSANEIPDDPSVTLARQLKMTDYKAFYIAIKSIPPKSLEDFLFHKGIENPFAPLELNILTPFLVEGSKSGGTDFGNPAQVNLCRLNDPRAATYFLERRIRLAPKFLYSSELRTVDPCLKKYKDAGLIPATSPKLAEVEILKHEESQLEDLSLGRQPSDDSTFNNVIQDVTALENKSNPMGWELLRVYIDPKYQHPTLDALIGYLGRTLRGNPNVTALVAFALENPRGAVDTSNLSSACNYFDQHAPRTLQQLYGENYAKGIFTSFKALEMFSKKMHGNLGQPWAKPAAASCTSAFKSQLADPGTRSKFMATVYPSMDPADKKLVEDLQK